MLGGPVPLPAWSSFDPFAAVVAISSFIVLWRFKANVLWVVGVSALAGAVRILV
jgi:hypothetical protein